MGWNDPARRLKGWLGYTAGVLVLLGFLLGWVLAIGSVADLWGLYAARNWEPREAVITNAYVRRIRGSGWRVEIAGRYADGSGTFGVPRHALGIQHAVITRAQAEAVVARYPKGTTLMAYAEPGRPRTAILEPGASPVPTWISLGAGIAMVLLPVALYLIGRRRSGRAA